MDARATTAVDETAERLACRRCVGEAQLRAEIRELGFVATCAYCGREGECVDVAWLADRLHAAIQTGFVATPADAPGAPTRRVVADVGGLGRALAGDVHAQLAALHLDADGTALYGRGLRYALPPSDARPRAATWRAYADAAAAGDVAAMLDVLKWAFADFADWRTAKGRPVVRALRERTRVYRARAVEDLGATALGFDAALGVDGALDARTALAEQRPARGALMIVTRWRLVRPVQVLDLDAARKALARTSVFAPGGAEAQARAQFAGKLAKRLRRGADAFAARLALDWLAHGATPRLDGVVLDSRRGGGRKLVLFARVGATGGLAPDRERRYATGGVERRRRRGDSTGSGALVDADGEQGGEADELQDDQFH